MKNLFALFSVIALLICMAMPTSVQADTRTDCDVGFHATTPAMAQGYHSITTFEAATDAATAILTTTLPAHYHGLDELAPMRMAVFACKFWEGQNTKASIRKAVLNTKPYSENFARTRYMFGRDIRRLS